MSKRLSFSIAVNLLTENFKKGTNTVKNSLRSLQMQVITFAAALGAGGLGISGLISRFRDVARETSRVLTALKNVSDGSKGFADNLRFVNDLAKKYGLEINALTGNFAKFTASATQANMPMEQQKKVFESVSRAITAFGLSASESDGVMLALSQMMSKGKISMEELRKQMGEKLPVAIQAMAKALGVSIGEMEKLIGTGKVMSADVLPKFADALNEIIPNVDTDNLETSLSRLSNMFGEIVNASGFQNKYKALIDGLTSLLESASKNIQNIIVGIVAAIGFVVTRGLTKIHQGHVNTGNMIVANAEAVRKKMIASAQSRIIAENKLEDLKLQHAQATGAKQVQLANQIEKQKQLVSAKTLATNKLHEEAKALNAQVSAAKANTYWGRAYLGMRVAANKLMASIKSMWNSFAPAIIISAIIAVIGYFKNLYDETKRVKNIFSDYKKEAENAGNNNQEIKNLQTQLSIMNDKKKGVEDIKSAQAALNKMLGVEGKNQEELNKLVAKRVELLIAAAKADYHTRKSLEAEDEREKVYAKYGGKEGFNKALEKREQNLSNMNPIDRAVSNYGKKKGWHNSFLSPQITKDVIAIEQYNKVIQDADEAIKEYTNEANKLTPFTPTGGDPDNKALRAAEKRLEALRKLDEEDRKRQIEKQKFDLDLQQKAIDLMDDSFEKRTKQTLLNLEKEKLAIEEYQSNLLKDQQEHLKTKYESVHGTDKGFGKYFKQAQANNFKDASGASILPEGLRPEDIEKQVNQLLGAAQNAQRKGLADINKDLSTMLREQQLMFASDLTKKLADLDTYYNEQRIKAGNNADLIKQIEANRTREKKAVTTDDKLKRLDFEEQLKLERAAGMESVGMTELVEEKKLEITRRYLQLRINALDKLAFEGDEEAFKQMQLLQSSLKKLDTQKPAKSLKALADKAIFNTIKKGFESAGDSAEEAEVKTTKLLGSISEKAGMIANITSELQSMFGGLDEGLDEALSTVGNIASGFASGGIVGGAMAVVGEGMKLFSKASEAAARHQKALEEIAAARLASQRAYNLLLREQNLLLEEAVSIFGEEQIRRATNAIQNYRDSIGDLQNEMQGNAPVKNFFQLNKYRKELDAYNKGIGGLYNATIVTGHKKTGLFGWGKGKDVYSSILDEYDDVLDKEGKLNIARIQNILDTRKMSDETRNYLQNLVDLQDAAEVAQEELRNYLQATFGSLGDDIMTSLENAIRDRGISAWEDFGKAGAKVIENLGKQIAYELFFAKKFAKLQEDLESIYGSGKSEEDIARESMKLVGQFYQNIGKDMELAQGFMENWQKEAEKYGFDLWNNESTSQSPSKGYSVSMDQDTGDKMVGILTSMQMSGFKMEGLLSVISMDTANIFKQTTSINSEMTKQTNILNNIYQVSRNSFFEVEGTGKYLKDMNGKLSNIETYTKALE